MRSSLNVGDSLHELSYSDAKAKFDFHRVSQEGNTVNLPALAYRTKVRVEWIPFDSNKIVDIAGKK